MDCPGRDNKPRHVCVGVSVPVCVSVYVCVRVSSTLPVVCLTNLVEVWWARIHDQNLQKLFFTPSVTLRKVFAFGETMHTHTFKQVNIYFLCVFVYVDVYFCLFSACVCQRQCIKHHFLYLCLIEVAFTFSVWLTRRMWSNINSNFHASTVYRDTQTQTSVENLPCLWWRKDSMSSNIWH